jgi:hypothetical protein
MRRYRTVVVSALLAVAVLAAVVFVSHSAPVAITVLALGILLGFLADFWTFRNLSWDPENEGTPPGGASA